MEFKKDVGLEKFEITDFQCNLQASTILVIHDGTSEASVAQYTGRISQILIEWQFLSRHYSETTIDDILQSDIIIVMRYLGEIPYFAIAQMFKIPVYYYTDDNFLSLDSSHIFPEAIQLTIKNTNREVLSCFSGVVLSTPSLLEYFANNKLHDSLFLHTQIFAPDSIFPHSRNTNCIRIAFFAGAHRQSAFIDYVFPALVNMSLKVPIELYMCPIPRFSEQQTEKLKIFTLPYMQFEEGLRTYAQKQIDILVYPSTPQENNRYKDANALFSAVSMDAVLIGSEDEPLVSLQEHERYCILVKNSVCEWEKAFTNFLEHPEGMINLKKNALEYCKNTSGASTIIKDYTDWVNRGKQISIDKRVRKICVNLLKQQHIMEQQLDEQKMLLTELGKDYRQAIEQCTLLKQRLDVLEKAFNEGLERNSKQAQSQYKELEQRLKKQQQDQYNAVKQDIRDQSEEFTDRLRKNSTQMLSRCNEMEQSLKERQQELSEDIKTNCEQLRCQVNMLLQVKQDLETHSGQIKQREQYQQALLLELMNRTQPSRLRTKIDKLCGLPRKADLTNSLEISQPAFIYGLRNLGNLYFADCRLAVSNIIPFDAYFEYPIRGRGAELHFFLFASPGGTLLLEAVKECKIIKQEHIILNGDGEIILTMAIDENVPILIRMKTLDNYSIVRTLEAVYSPISCRQSRELAYFVK